MKLRSGLLAASIVAAGVCTLFLRGDLRTVAGEQWKPESMTYLPQGERIKPAFLGFEATAAHYLWIRTVLYFGGHFMGDREFSWLTDMIDIITRLCPWFYPAYEFAGLMIPDHCGNPEAARIILERGLTHLGATRWKLAFMTGMVHYRYYGDRKTAAGYFARAAMVKGAPREKLASLAHDFYTGAGSAAEGLSFLLFAYETAESPEARANLAEKIRELEARLLQPVKH